LGLEVVNQASSLRGFIVIEIQPTATLHRIAPLFTAGIGHKFRLYAAHHPVKSCRTFATSF
jgi:hypothetical protein